MTVVPDDLYSDAFRADPHPVWRELRHEHPVFHDTISGAFVVSRHADVDVGFRDHERLSNRSYLFTTGRVFGSTMLDLDGPDHVARRSVVAPEFVGKRLAAFLPVLERNIAELIEGIAGRAEFDLVDGFTTRLPINVILDMLAFDKRDHEQFHRWYSTMMSGLGRTNHLRAAGQAAHAEVCAFVEPLLTERRACPGTDLLTRIAFAEADGNRLSDDEVKSFVSLMLVAGGETTDKAIANLWWNLLRTPDALDAVLADPDLLDAAFSESMRKDGPVQWEDRIATESFTWHGVEIPEGSWVRLGVASANNDETIFGPDPRAYRMDRPELHLGKEVRVGGLVEGRNSHLGFGVAKHFCLGYELARAEAVLGTRRLLEAVGRPSFAGEEPALQWMGGFRSLPSLLVRRAG
jgi:pulcherriminic acid synthase